MKTPEESSSITLSALHAFSDTLSRSLFCALPGIVHSFDRETQTVTIQPAVQDRLRDGTTVDFPLLTDVPVFFPGTKSSAITWVVEPGDECLVIFADRNIDPWFTTSTPAPGEIPRTHSLSDGFAFVGFRSKPNALQSFPDTPTFFGGDPQ